MQLDETNLAGCSLRIKPLNDHQAVTEFSESGDTNLYLKDIAKSATASQVRRALAVYGRLSSFNLVNKPEFMTNIAFASFVSPVHAKQAFSNVTFAATHLGNFSVFWHKPKNVSHQKQSLITEISK